MPPKGRRARVIPPSSSAPTALEDDGDPLASTPLRPPQPTQGGTRKRKADLTTPETRSRSSATPSLPSSTAAARRTRATQRPPASKRAVAQSRTTDGGLIWGGGEDLVPPSDEDEFEEWVQQREIQRAREAGPSSPVSARIKGKGREVPPSSTTGGSPVCTPMSPLNGCANDKIAVDRDDVDPLAPGPSRSITPETIPLPLQHAFAASSSSSPVTLGKVRFALFEDDEDLALSDDEILSEDEELDVEMEQEEALAGHDSTSPSIPGIIDGSTEDLLEEWPKTGVGGPEDSSFGDAPEDGSMVVDEEPQSPGTPPMSLRDEMEEDPPDHGLDTSMPPSQDPDDPPLPSGSALSELIPSMSDVQAAPPSRPTESQGLDNRLVGTALPRIRPTATAMLLTSPITPAKPAQQSRLSASPASPLQYRFLSQREESPDPLAMSHRSPPLPSAGDGHESPIASLAILDANPREAESIGMDSPLSPPVHLGVPTLDAESELTPLPPSLPPAPLLPQWPPAAESIRPADPALEQFRSARSFRTRTVLQLQPYTRERQIYEAALRRGGLAAGKHAVARPREITPGERDDETAELWQAASTSSAESGKEAEAEEEERIVIGATPPAAPRRAPRSPKVVESADKDEFFVRYKREADPDDEKDERKLQRIVRERLRAEKEERKRQRQAARTTREFEELMRDGSEAPNRKKDRPADKEERGPKAAKRSAATAPKPRLPGQLQTYGRVAKPPPITIDSDSSDSAPPPRPPRTQGQGPLRTSTPALSGTNSSAPSLLPPLSPDAEIPELDFGFDGGMAYNDDPVFVHDARSPSPSRQTRRRHSSSSSASVSSTPDDAPAEDKRAKIARKMLPAVMLRRLEREAQDAEKRKADRKRQEARKNNVTPARPGKAVTRKGAGGDVDLADLNTGDSDDSDMSLPPPSRRPALGAASSMDNPIVISDNESDSSSQAEEDNHAGNETLARLYDGDYESIVTGNRFQGRRKANLHTRALMRNFHDRTRERKSRRPALGFAPPRNSTHTSSKNGAHSPRRLHVGGAHRSEMRQSKLAFPSEDRHDKVQSHKKRKLHGDTSRFERRPKPPARRPAIRLDDHVIFATADFAFDSEPDPTPVPEEPPRLTVVKPNGASRTLQVPAKRPLATTVIRQPVNNAAGQEHVDVGVGKARSWANFDKFPIDFGITPLPSGLYCSPASVVGAGDVVALLDGLAGLTAISAETCVAYDLEFRGDMDLDELRTIFPIYVERLMGNILDLAENRVSTSPEFAPLRLLTNLVSNADEPRADVDDLLRSVSGSLASKLDTVKLPLRKRERPARDAILTLRYHLLALAYRPSLNSSDSLPASSEPLRSPAISLINALLSSGFDKTLQPLKAILKGEFESPEIKDITVILWIAVIQILQHARASTSEDDLFVSCLSTALDETFRHDQTGPIAAERVWFLLFGLCALSQFGPDGRVDGNFIPSPRWALVRRGVGLIKIAHNEEAEERAHLDQLHGRDRYIRTIMARCIRLSSVWKWEFDRQSFSVVTKDLGVIFKDRQYRNLPTEAPVDYPTWITGFDISLTASEDSRSETAFELYLRLVCVAASDIISNAESLAAAQQAERDVQRLIMSILPVNPVKFNRLFPPTPRQMGQLVNRYSTMIAACYFCPSLLVNLLAKFRVWAPFEMADLESRQISIRGLMYLAVACRHHGLSVRPIVDKLADILGILQAELDDQAKGTAPPQMASRREVQRTMVLVVTNFRYIIKHHSYDPARQVEAVYPEPCLLHHSWTSRIFELAASDPRSGLEIISAIQAFLDERSNALPRRARAAREERLESQDEYGSFGFELDEITIVGLGGPSKDDATENMDEEFASIVEKEICPRIYRLLSDLLPAVTDDGERPRTDERDTYLSRLTKCWSDCAAVVVVEHRKLDWSTFIGPFGKLSWSRLGDEAGRVQVGLYFMLNVARLDPASFSKHEEDFIDLFFHTVVSSKITIEHEYVLALLAMNGVLRHPLFEGVDALPGVGRRKQWTIPEFEELRPSILDVVFGNLGSLFASKETWATSHKALLYRCANLLISSLVFYEKSIDPTRVIQHSSYRAFAKTTIRSLLHHTSAYINSASIPSLKHFD